MGVYSVLVNKDTPMGYYLLEKGEIVMTKKAACSCDKKTARTAQERRKLINRLNRIEGQIRGIKGMVEKDAYCPDILTQCAAASAALNSFNRDLIGHHIKGWICSKNL